MKKKNIYSLFPVVYLTIYIFIFIWGAINPNYRTAWFAESILAIIIIPILVLTYKKFRFSNTSYTLMFIFLILQVIGSHYTYAEVPFGFWLQNMFDFSRNHYDRIVHFMFGLLLYLPTLELYRKLTKNTSKTFFNYFITMLVLMGLGAVFEVLEYLYAVFTSPTLSTAYLGTQGDEWDSYKGLTLKLISSSIIMLYFYLKKK